MGVVTGVFSRSMTDAFSRSVPFLFDDEEDPFKYFTRLVRQRGPPAERQRRQDAREPLPFEGGSVAGAPLAWTLVWGGTYSTMYNALSRMQRAWACVMWDAARLRGTGADEAVLRQWAAAWGSYDPRDYTGPNIH